MSRVVVPRPAATTLVVRDQGGAVEVLMVRRSLSASFMPGSYVFPGGAVDPADREASLATLCDEAAMDRATRLNLPDAALAQGFLVAAIRECFEECGLWLGAEGDLAPAHLATARAALRAGEAALADVAAQLGQNLRTRALAPWAHWVTPMAVPKRFDTRFFVAQAPAGQEPSIDNTETIATEWLRPDQALARHTQGEFALPIVTVQVLESLRPFGSVAALLEHGHSQRQIPCHLPHVALDAKGQRRTVLPHEPAFAETWRLDPQGAVSARCALLPGEVVTLAPAVRRITAPNAGVMTGPGTNSYLIGRGGESLVLDPGPVLEEHLETLLAAAGRVRGILVTHTHADHSPGAARLAALTGAPCIGLPAPAQRRQDASFVPAVQPADGQVFELAGVRLQAVHTPGHASNHVCWWLEEEQMLFTGDHLMQGSTVVIDPPDGDMAAYLASLQSLPQRLPDMAWLAPGHGFLIAEPQRAIDRLVAHRLSREVKVLDGLRSMGHCSLPDLLLRVYDDVPPQLYPVATRSLLAHLLKLQLEGRAEEAGGQWRVLTVL